jgi:aminopeptidase N
VGAQRLPGGVRPVRYGLTVTPDLAAGTFAGEETIEVVLDAPAVAITLNAAEIRFGSVEAAVGAAVGAPASWATAAVALDAGKEQATFRFAEALPAGPVTLRIRYTGVLNDKLRGFYRSRVRRGAKDASHNAVGGGTSGGAGGGDGGLVAVTQFEPTDARRAFPCFDEPGLKATFDVTLVVDKGAMAISNMDAVSDEAGPVEGKHTVRFRTTPRMPTYLVAFLVGEFKCSKGGADGVKIRVCAAAQPEGDTRKLTQFALEAAERALRYDDAYFGIRYPLPKMDLIALPDFEAGAMENFGALTFRESELLAEPGGHRRRGPDGDRKEVALTVAHEIAHQWFGDLVTMGWWDDLWLNEGFATWMETKTVAAWHLEWGLAEDDAEALDEVMREDGERSTRAIRVAVSTPDEINQLFDGIAYQKSGAVIGMVEQWVGQDVFRDGVRRYLQAHLYGTATAEDFWAAETETSKLQVDAVMRSFVEQPGVPLVAFAGGKDGAVAVTQRKYSVAAGDGAGAGARVWTIPVCAKMMGAAGCSVVGGGGGVVAGSGSGFLFGSAGDKGYYRAAYAPELRAAIVSHAETGLTAAERIGLVGDEWALVRAEAAPGLTDGHVGVGEFLDLVLALKRDPSAAVMETALDKLANVEDEIATDADRARLDAVVRREFGPVYAELAEKTGDWGESFERQGLRALLFETLGRAGDESVLARARTATAALLREGKGAKREDPAIAEAAIAVTARQSRGGDAATLYDRMQAAAERAREPGVETEALHALTRFEDPALAERTLEYAVSGKVRNQDSGGMVAALLAERETRDQTWEFVRGHWDAVRAQLTVGSGAQLVGAAGSFCTVARRDEVATFFAAHTVEAADRSLAEALERIEDCAAVRAAQEAGLRQWLAARP